MEIKSNYVFTLFHFFKEQSLRSVAHGKIEPFAVVAGVARGLHIRLKTCGTRVCEADIIEIARRIYGIAVLMLAPLATGVSFPFSTRKYSRFTVSSPPPFSTFWAGAR